MWLVNNHKQVVSNAMHTLEADVTKLKRVRTNIQNGIRPISKTNEQLDRV